MAKSRVSKTYIGTSGWSYDWDNFYPQGFSANKRLSYFSRHFLTAEVNYSFYQLPRESTYEKWKKETPEDFIFALKLSRYITHIKRLSEAKDLLKTFLSRAKILGEKLGPILIQLPPNFRINPERLQAFLGEAAEIKKKLKIADLRLAFEFRHLSWFEPSLDRKEILKILKKHKTAFAFAHSSRHPYPQDEPLTAGFVYFRFHGPGALFASRYGKRKLGLWAEKIEKLLKEGLDVYAYFNNDFNGYAVEDARSLIDLLSPAVQ